MSILVGQPIELIDTPAPLVHLDALERNITRMSRTIIDEAGVGWRPHTKSMKNLRHYKKEKKNNLYYIK